MKRLRWIEIQSPSWWIDLWSFKVASDAYLESCGNDLLELNRQKKQTGGALPTVVQALWIILCWFLSKTVWDHLVLASPFIRLCNLRGKTNNSLSPGVYAKFDSGLSLFSKTKVAIFGTKSLFAHGRTYRFDLCGITFPSWYCGNVLFWGERRKRKKNTVLHQLI